MLKLQDNIFAMILNEDFEIFKQHFEGYPLLPGALLLNLCKLVSEKKLNYSPNAKWSINFNLPIYPKDKIEIITAKKGKADLLCIYANEKKVSTAKVTEGTEKLKSNYIQENINELEWNVPIANHGEKILFLDKWAKVEKNNQLYCIGKYKFESDKLLFLKEIYQDSEIGQTFMLIEMMGLAVVSYLTKKDVIKLSDNYGFGKISGYQQKELKDKVNDLICFVEFSVIQDKIIRWSGEVMCKNEVIAKVDEVINIPLNKGVIINE